MVFKIQPHNRLQEWVAEEKGYFADEGLEYVFHAGDNVVRHYTYQSGPGPGAASQGNASQVDERDDHTGLNGGGIQSTEEATAEVKQGAFEAMEAGRTCDISAACHWAVNMAASGQHGKMWGHAYSVTPAGIYVAPESSIRRPEDLVGTNVGVGYHSGSHSSALQALEAFLSLDQINLSFIGRPNDRVAQLIDRKIEAANVFGMQTYILEQQGFRKVADTSFMIGFLISGQDTDVQDVEKYFRALRRAQRDIDIAYQKYTHYFLREMPEEFTSIVDVRAFGPGERLVFEPYTRDMYEQTHRWMAERQLFGADQAGEARFESAVLV